MVSTSLSHRLKQGAYGAMPVTSPETSNPECVELRIRTEDRDVRSEGLGCYHSVKRISMFANEAACAESTLDVDV